MRAHPWPRGPAASYSENAVEHTFLELELSARRPTSTARKASYRRKFPPQGTVQQIEVSNLSGAMEAAAPRQLAHATSVAVCCRAGLLTGRSRLIALIGCHNLNAHGLHSVDSGTAQRKQVLELPSMDNVLRDAL